MSRGRHHRRHSGRELYRAAWWWVASLLGTVGTAAAYLSLGPGGSLALMVGTAVLATLAAWQLGPRRGEAPLDARSAVLGLGAGLAMLAVVGLTLLAGGAGFGCSVLVATAGWPLRPRRPSPASRPGAAQGTTRRPVGPPLEQLSADRLPTAETLRAMSAAELCQAWRLSYTRLCRAALPSYVDDLAAFRRACLDELERRDPAAFARWLPTARAASDPARFFCRESQR